MRELDKVVLKYGRVNGKPYSFKDHEFQQEIIRDTSARIDVQKCSQVGLSEVMVQKTIAMGATMKHIRIIFTLPTRDMAMPFSKDRFDTAIDSSDFYSGLVHKASNSASQKKIGTCTLYITGSFGANSAISVPAEVVISDEVDFSNEVVLGKLNSRLRHASMVDEMGNRGMRMRFSTPTVDDYGVNKGFLAGNQMHYMVKCLGCKQWVLPDFDHDFIVPGFDDSIVKFGREDVSDPRFRIQESYIKCPCCGKDLQQALLNPERRQWVAKRPDVWDHSYQVFPWDVPKYNTPPAIIKQMGDYPLRSDFYNFVIGLPHSDAENNFTVTDEHRKRVSDVDLWIYKQWAVTCQTIGGMDIGKVCHFVVKAKVGRHWHVVWAEKIHNTRENPATGQVIERYDYFRMAMLCIDAGPDITLVNSLVGARQGIRAVVYVGKVSGILPIDEKADGMVVNADRTKTLSLLLNKHNAGEIHYPMREEITKEIFEHLKTTKKIRAKGPDGEMVERFIKTSDTDHWVHALNYSNIAALIIEDLGLSAIISAPPCVGKVKVGSNAGNKPVERTGW
ncbi:MAG: phage terminase large subunit family protein [Alphaproteobacteria bacterium]|nr:phage terminase large subunit family protein [Alphaproteobacteria bacterium]